MDTICSREDEGARSQAAMAQLRELEVTVLSAQDSKSVKPMEGA